MTSFMPLHRSTISITAASIFFSCWLCSFSCVCDPSHLRTHTVLASSLVEGVLSAFLELSLGQLAGHTPTHKPSLFVEVICKPTKLSPNVKVLSLPPCCKLQFDLTHSCVVQSLHLVCSRNTCLSRLWDESILGHRPGLYCCMCVACKKQWNAKWTPRRIISAVFCWFKINSFAFVQYFTGAGSSSAINFFAKCLRFSYRDTWASLRPFSW